MESEPAARSAGGGAVKVWLAILLLALTAYGGYTLWRVLEARRTASSSPAPSAVWVDYDLGDFQLVDAASKTFSPEDMEGKVWVASFFFTTCRSGCYALNHSIAELLKDDLADVPVTFVSISVDPETDTPKKLAEYSGAFFLNDDKIDPERWLFVTDPKGRQAAVQAISTVNFKVPFSKNTHNSDYLLVDQSGTVRGKYSPGSEPDVRAMKKKIEELLAAPPTRGEME